MPAAQKCGSSGLAGRLVAGHRAGWTVRAMSEAEQTPVQFVARPSTLTKAGHLVVVRLPQDAVVLCRWTPPTPSASPSQSTPPAGAAARPGDGGRTGYDDGEDLTQPAEAAEVTDVTGWFADLVVIGWADTNEATAAGTPHPAQERDVAMLSIEPATAAGLMTCTYVHLPTGQTAEVAPAAALTFAARGVAVQVTAGIAREISDDELPDDARDLGIA